MVSVIAVCVPARKYLHEVVVGGWIPLGGHSRSSVLEEGKCPCEAFLRGELLGFVDKLHGRWVELESWARMRLGLLKGSGELVHSWTNCCNWGAG